MREEMGGRCGFYGGPRHSCSIPPAPVVFDLPDFTLDGDLIRMRAVDDLAGCSAGLAAMERLVSDGASANVYSVFTRAEEGGLYGARLMAEARTLPEETLVVSVESSPLIPGVEQGRGPVIRTGDALYTFDADAEQALIVARESIRERNPEFKSQRQLMSGGVCEGTAFAVWGYRATGMAFPLGNYHNATTGIRDPEIGRRCGVHPGRGLSGRSRSADRGGAERVRSVRFAGSGASAGGAGRRAGADDSEGVSSESARREGRLRSGPTRLVVQ